MLNDELIAKIAEKLATPEPFREWLDNQPLEHVFFGDEADAWGIAQFVNSEFPGNGLRCSEDHIFTGKEIGDIKDLVTLPDWAAAFSTISFNRYKGMAQKLLEAKLLLDEAIDNKDDFDYIDSTAIDEDNDDYGFWRNKTRDNPI